MDEKFKYLASRRSDAELYERINNREKYLPETVEASVAELQARGEIFEDDVLAAISADMDARRQNAEAPATNSGMFNNADKAQQVEDPDAPDFYSKRAIYAFAILFSVLFASIMFAVNVGKTDRKVNIIWVLLFGFAFTVVEIMIAFTVSASFGLALIFGIIGAYIINYFMWPSFLGKSALYRVKPIWIPLIIGLSFCALYIYAALAPHK